MFLEIKLDDRTGKEKGQQEVSGEIILTKHPDNHDIQAWVQGARIGSVFSIIACGYKYKRLPD